MHLKICKLAINSTYKKEKWKVALTVIGVILAVAVYATTRIGTEIAKGQARTGLNDVSAYHISGDNLSSLYKKLLNTTTASVTPWIIKDDQVATDGLNLYLFCELSLNDDDPLALLKGGYISVGDHQIAEKNKLGTCNLNGLAPIKNSTLSIVDIAGFDLETVSTLSVVGKPSEVSSVITTLPSDLKISESEATGSTAADHATKAMRLNLKVLAILSFVVAGLLVYNTISYLTLLRKRDYSTMLAIGASPKSISKSLYLEAIALGFIGTVLGTIVGEIASELVFKDMMRNTVSLLYRLDSYSESKISYLTVFSESLLLALATCLLASTIASKEIKNESPAVGLDYVRAEHTNSIPTVRLLIAFAVLACLAALATSPALLKLSTWLGFISPVLVLGAGACLAPCVLKFFANFLIRSSKVTSTKTAANQILMTPTRSSVAVISLALALGLSLAIGIFVNSFRDSVESWIFDIAKADVFISRASPGSEPLLSTETLNKLASNPNAIDYDTQSSQFITYKDRKVLVSSFDFDIAKKYNRMTILDGVFDNSTTNSKILVSEPFFSIFKNAPGSSINIAGYEAEITAVVKDYTSNVGVVFLDNSFYQKIFPGTSEDSYSIYTNGTDIRSMLTDPGIVVQSKEELAEAVLTIFDLVLSLTSVVQIAALAVAVLSLFTSLSMIFIERKYELATLFAVGASSKQIRATVIKEALILAVSGLITGLLVGLLLGLVLVFSVNKHFFGWSVAFSFSELNILFVSLLTLLTAILCGGILARGVKPDTLIVATRYS